MRRTCQQSRRWHQQFFLSTSHLGHRHCVQQLWLPLQSQQRYYARNRDNDVVVHEYEQEGSDKKTRVAVNPKAELEAARDLLKSKLDRLDKELAEMRDGPFGPHSDFMKSLSSEERQIAQEALQKGGEAYDFQVDDIDTTELDEIMEDESKKPDEIIDNNLSPRITLNRPKQHRVYIRHINAVLAEMSAGPQTQAQNHKLWSSYQRCLRHMPDFLTVLPPKVWDVLWQSQKDLPNNAKNILALAKDAVTHAVPLSAQQTMVYIETLRMTGDRALAIEQWNENRSILGPNPDVAKRFWSLGVQLYSDNKQTLKAENIAMQCLNQGSLVDATILLPLINSLVRENTKGSLEKAWTYYLRFKADVGKGIRPEDYESISVALLDHGNINMALTVFKDMFLAVAKDDYQEHNSLSTYKALAGFIGKVQESAISEWHVSRVSLAALTVLPRFLENKFFYASWIKRLIGLREVDAAAKVVELMYERGIRPDARHLNGIIGAWLRHGSDVSRGKAEKMAWDMIDARLDLVRLRELGVRQKQIGSSKDRAPPRIRNRLVPSATLETFSILLLHYSRHSLENAANELMSVMTGQATMEPNAFIWNHWLRSSLRSQNLEAVWNQFLNMKGHVQPDLETFACLWDAAKVQWDPSRSTHWSGFPTARRLFQEMQTWLSLLPHAQSIRARHEFSRELYDQIIRVFCLSQDLRGTLCALHGLKHLFHESPDDATSRIVTISIARLLPPDFGHHPTGRRGSRRKVASMTTALTAVSSILRIVGERRAVALLDVGLDPNQLEDGVAQQLQLDVLSDLLVAVLQRLASERGDVENEVKNVAEWMGVHVGGVDFRKEETDRS